MVKEKRWINREKPDVPGKAQKGGECESDGHFRLRWNCSAAGLKASNNFFAVIFFFPLEVSWKVSIIADDYSVLGVRVDCLFDACKNLSHFNNMSAQASVRRLNFRHHLHKLRLRILETNFQMLVNTLWLHTV